MTQRAMARLERNARRILEDFERVVGEISQTGKQKTDSIAARLCNETDTVRDQLIDFEENAIVRARSVGRRARTYVKHHPWTAGGIALTAATIAFGLLTWRRRH